MKLPFVVTWIELAPLYAKSDITCSHFCTLVSQCHREIEWDCGHWRLGRALEKAN